LAIPLLWQLGAMEGEQMTSKARPQHSSVGTAHVKCQLSMMVAFFLLLQACAVPAATVSAQDTPAAAEQISILDDSTAPEQAEPVTAAIGESRQEDLLSPEAKRNIGLCLLAGPLCAAVLLYVGTYFATAAAICAPVAAITTPMGDNTFQEEIAHCMKTTFK
jgi:hypothetical protein